MKSLNKFIVFVVFLCEIKSTLCNPHANQLYEDLFYWYQRNVRPVANASDVININVGASLIRIIELNEVSQMLTANLWLELQWVDNKLKWDPEDHGGVTKLNVPSDMIWTPDIVLYNNAAGNPQITIMVDALVFYDGTVVWKPPAIYNSFCKINIEYFPYDEQFCFLKFGAWTHTGEYLDLTQMIVDINEHVEHDCPNSALLYRSQSHKDTCKAFLKTGMDISNYQMNAEWDVLSIESRRHSVEYSGCCGAVPYHDITFVLNMRRKPLFFTINLVIPCMLIAILTTFVFYIPFKGHKITFAISILVTLTIFFLVLIDLIPPTSLVIPLIAKYLLFTIILVAVSIFVSVITLNIYHRSGTTHTMPHWVRWLFLKKLPSKLCIKPQDDTDDEVDTISCDSDVVSPLRGRRPSPFIIGGNVEQYANRQLRLSQLAELRGLHPDVIRRMIDNVSFIGEHYRAQQAEDKVSEDWSYVAMVIDRLFLILFTIVNVFGTIVIILQAPSLYDNRPQMSIPDAYKPLGGDTGPPHLLNMYENMSDHQP